MDYDPRHLRALLGVVEHGSFNQAATALGLTQPAISKGIAALERATGAPLFVRGIRGASLTKAGQVVDRVARRTLALLQNAKDEVAALARGSAGRLRIGATPSAMLGGVPVACANLGKANGPMELTICEGLDDELLPALEGGEIDLLIGPVGDGYHSDAHITEAVLLHERVSIGCAPAMNWPRAGVFAWRTSSIGPGYSLREGAVSTHWLKRRSSLQRYLGRRTS